MTGYLIVFLISMLPMIELRGAIPYSQIIGLPLLPSYLVAILGNLLPAPFIYLFAQKILYWGKDKPYIGKFFTWCIKKGHSNEDKILKKDRKAIFLALVLFVGIPIPGTGAWTGTLAASFLDLDFKWMVLSVFAGILLAGIIMALGTSGVFMTLRMLFGV